MGIIDRIKGSYDAGAESAARKRAEHARRVEEAKKAELQKRAAARSTAKAQPIKPIASVGSFVETARPYLKSAGTAAKNTGKVLEKSGKFAAGAARSMSPPPAKSRSRSQDPLDSMFLTSGPGPRSPGTGTKKKRRKRSSSSSDDYDDIGRLW